ncbi:MAG: hypothetical protein J6M38_13115 [Lentisphaeria bacterium]|nr:hypothetical protein [Lentisphaeria bacterium]
MITPLPPVGGWDAAGFMCANRIAEQSQCILKQFFPADGRIQRVQFGMCRHDCQCGADILIALNRPVIAFSCPVIEKFGTMGGRMEKIRECFEPRHHPFQIMF